MSYTYKDVTTSTSGTENTCAAGSSARIQCNKSWKITVRNINRGDKVNRNIYLSEVLNIINSD